MINIMTGPFTVVTEARKFDFMTVQQLLFAGKWNEERRL